MGNEPAQQLIESTLDVLREAATCHNGRLIKTIGDEVMCRFDTASDAAHAALDMQRRLRLVPIETGGSLHVKIGFAYGAVVDRDGDVFGDVVNVASRLAALAKADQILTTEATAALFEPDLQACSRLFDKAPVKGIGEELSVVQVLWEERNQTALVRLSPAENVMAHCLELSCREQRWKLTPPDLPRWIGRSDECEIPLPVPLASRKHVRLEYRRGKFMLVDESSNGTYVEMKDADGVRVMYVRNEAFALVGTGRFALGTRPEADEYTVTFKTG